MNRLELLISLEHYHKLEEFVEKLCYDLGLEKTYFSNIVSASEFLFDIYIRYYEHEVLVVSSSLNEEGLGIEFRLVFNQVDAESDFIPKLSEVFGQDMYSLQTISDRFKIDEQSHTVYILFNTTAQFDTKAQRRIDLLAGYFEKQTQRHRAVK
jgi:hypothetical protein